MKIVLTICSRDKNQRPELLPAEDRYIASHITSTREMASKSGTPFYILSGRYGVILGKTEIHYYDYYLEESKIEELMQIVTEQLKDQGITEIEFYVKDKDSWNPYRKVIKGAAQKNGVILKEIVL